jgi:hypothetical protein
MDKIEKYDDALRKKNFHVLEVEDRCNSITDLELFRQQFMTGAKNICTQYYNKRPFELTKEEYKDWLKK